MRHFPLKTIYIAVLSASCVGVAWADNTAKTESKTPSVTLKGLTVTVDRKLGRKSTEVTGLGKIVKSSDDIDKEQIMGIRDLTRYDPGISVVEQGRGATSGYSIRGVDKNRVGLQVDGLVQIQSYTTEHSRANGGAINEIEYENVRSIELSKGSASSEFGSGALGGAVSFRTKNADDIIQDGKNWGVATKTAYSSKNKQLANTVGVAGRAGGFDALVQYTNRQGKETSVHKHITNLPQTFERVGAYLSDGTDKFILQDECPDGNCTPKARAKMTWHTLPEGKNHVLETVSASDYTGENRIMPNPMDYQSKSIFSKMGYRFDDEHYLGAVLENTKQQYDIQDKSKTAYVDPKNIDPHERNNKLSTSENGISLTQGVYFGNNPLAGISILRHPNQIALGYTRGYYIDEHHDKNRYGLFYKYTPKGGLVDGLNVSYDRQSIDLDTLRRETNCSVYPTFDEHCRADIKKPLSAYMSEKVNYQEIHNVLQINADKRFKIADTTHKVNLLAGVDSFNSKLNRGEWFAEQARYKHGENEPDDIFKRVDGKPNTYQLQPMSIIRQDLCKNGFSTQDCTDRNITGHNHFIAVKDHMELGEKVDLGLGLRYDRHHFKSSDPFTSTGKYNNWSWNAGLTYRPIENVALSYRRSNGFRVPAFYELYGRRGALDKNNDVSVTRQYVAKLEPEKSSNQEFGVGLKGDFGYLEVSHFDNDYRDLIVTATQKIEGGTTANDGYHNLHDIKLSGINVLGKVDWYGLWQKMPDGLYSTFAYNKITPKRVKQKEGYDQVHSPILDTLQPARYVASVGYDSPDDKWGLNFLATYSKAKNINELQGNSTYGIARHSNTAQGATKAWYTYDLTGFWQANDNITLRAGVYNILARKYSTWESVRQSSVNAVNRINAQPARYAAPGRNFSLALEMKF